MPTTQPQAGAERFGGTAAAARGNDLRVLHVLPSLVGGGMERLIVSLVSRRADGSHEGEDAGGTVHGLCVLRDADQELLSQCRVSASTWVLGGCREPSRSAHRWSWWRLRQIVRRFQPDIVHAVSTGVWFDAALATRGLHRTSLVLAFHGRTDLLAPGWRRRWIIRWTTQQADAVLTVSPAVARTLRDEWHVGEDKLRMIPNGVDVERFQPVSGDDERRRIRRSIDVPPQANVAVCVANLVPIKALDVLLWAWRQVQMADRSARLLLIGDGRLRGELEQLARELRCESSVQFLGRREDVAGLLRAADVLVSSSRYEACSIAVLEAMAAGLPVVATDVGGTHELVRPGGTGWLVPAGSADRLAEALLAGLRDRLSSQRMGRAGRAVAVEQFSIGTCMKRYASLWRELAGRSESREAMVMEDLACAG